MRHLKTELNMLARLGFPKDPELLSSQKPYATEAYNVLTAGRWAHVIYGFCYKGKRARNKYRLDVSLPPKYFECFATDREFADRIDYLYGKGIWYIGAKHS